MDGKSKILIIEDDKYISGFIAVSLKKNGYDSWVAETASQGLFFFSSHHPDIVLLDLGLPDRDGLEVLEELRSFSQIPIIIISARGQEQEKVSALDAGADDYLTKPFFMGELLARIRVVERKRTSPGASETGTLFQCDWMTIDFEKRRVLIEEKEVHLTPIEYKLLTLLVHHRGKVLTHLFLLREVWGYGEGSDTKTVRVFMANLRRKIEKDTMKPRFILTEVGVGYRFADE